MTHGHLWLLLYTTVTYCILTCLYPLGVFRTDSSASASQLHLSQNEMAAEAAFKDVPEIFEVITRENVLYQPFYSDFRIGRVGGVPPRTN